jgi:repressor LexA
MPQIGELTARQREVLAFFEDRQRQTGLVPTLQETADHFGFKSANAVRQHLRLIEKKGFAHRVPRRSRALVVVRHDVRGDPDLVRVPLLGRIPAGNPTLAVEDTEALLTLPTLLFKETGLFALRVHGSSMMGAGIFDGDIAVLDTKSEVKDGMIAAVLIEEETTLKRICRRPKGLLLKAENPAFRDIEIPLDAAARVRVMGVLVGIVRRV